MEQYQQNLSVASSVVLIDSSIYSLQELCLSTFMQFSLDISLKFM